MEKPNLLVSKVKIVLILKHDLIYSYFCKSDSIKMKKAIFIGFLLLANIVLLAHAMIPHRHLDGIAVAHLESHCHDSTDSHHEDHDHDFNHRTTPHQHEDNPSEHCLLNIIYTRSESNMKIISPVYYNCGLLLFLDVPGTKDKFGLVDIVVLPIKQKPYSESFYSRFSSNSVGLRAPPVC